MKRCAFALVVLSACVDFDALDHCYGGTCPSATDPTSGQDAGADGGPRRAGPGIKPDETNTGVPPGVTLSVVDHDVAVTEDETVIDAQDIHGLLVISANRVTVTRSIVRGRSVSGEGAAINVTSGTGTLIEDCEVAVDATSPKLDGVWSRTATARRLDIHVGNVGMRISGNAVLEYSYVHGTSFGNAGGSSLSIASASGAHVTGNQLAATSVENAALQVTQGVGLVENLVVEANWAGGGSCTFNFADGGRPLSLTLQGNRFMGGSAHPNCPVVTTGAVTLVGTGNVWDDTGAAVVVQKL